MPVNTLASREDIDAPEELEELAEEVWFEICLLHGMLGVDYATSARVGKQFPDTSNYRVGHAMSYLCEDGRLEVFSASSPTTYRIVGAE